MIRHYAPCPKCNGTGLTSLLFATSSRPLTVEQFYREAGWATCDRCQGTKVIAKEDDR